MSLKEIIATHEYLKPAEAAALIRCTPATLKNWRLAGKGPPYLMRGSRVVYPVKHLQEWLSPPVAPGN